MITLISGTNREDSNTLRIAQHYYEVFRKAGADIHLLSLKDLPVHFRSPELIAVENELLIPANKFVFVIPEYNGSFPGVLKSMIDHSDIKKAWWNKKALLVGLASGRGGNARGLDQFANILNYLKVHVHYNKLLISKVHEQLDAEHKLFQTATLEQINYQIEDFLSF